MSNENFSFGHVLSRSDMRKLIAGYGDDETCYECLAGVTCNPTGPHGEGRTRCRIPMNGVCYLWGSRC